MPSSSPFGGFELTKREPWAGGPSEDELTVLESFSKVRPSAQLFETNGEGPWTGDGRYVVY